MATGFKRVTSPAASGSATVISCAITDVTASTSGDGWSCAYTATGQYVFTFTSGFSGLLGYSYSIRYDDAANPPATAVAALDDDAFPDFIVTAVTPSAGTIKVNSLALMRDAASTGAATAIASGVIVYHNFVLEMVGK